MPNPKDIKKFSIGLDFARNISADVSKFAQIMKQNYDLDLYEMQLWGNSTNRPIVVNGRTTVLINGKRKREYE